MIDPGIEAHLVQQQDPALARGSVQRAHLLRDVGRGDERDTAIEARPRDPDMLVRREEADDYVCPADLGQQLAFAGGVHFEGRGAGPPGEQRPRPLHVQRRQPQIDLSQLFEVIEQGLDDEPRTEDEDAFHAPERSRAEARWR